MYLNIYCILYSVYIIYGIRTKCQKTCTDKMPENEKPDKMPEDKMPEDKMTDNTYPKA